MGFRNRIEDNLITSTPTLKFIIKIKRGGHAEITLFGQKGQRATFNFQIENYLTGGGSKIVLKF